jgi:dolichol kinase
VGILPGPYTDALIARDLGASLLCAVLGVAFVKAVTILASIDVLNPRDSRKIIHTLSAPLFMLFWPLFSDAGGARYFAAIVPLANAVRLVVAASGSQDEEELASAVSRSGDAKEAIGGPFFYVVVLLASVLTFWRDDLTGIVAVSTMAAGDGLADLIGRRFGNGNKWPFNRDKSVAGSVAFFVGASSCSVALALWFGYTGVLTLPLELSDLAFRIVVISALSAVIELIPVVDDNWSVPLGAAILSAAFLH